MIQVRAAFGTLSPTSYEIRFALAISKVRK